MVAILSTRLLGVDPERAPAVAHNIEILADEPSAA
jgi:hypothetical protein